MKKNYLFLTALAAITISFSGCATLFSGGSYQQVNIQSKSDTVANIYKAPAKNYLSEDERKITMLRHYEPVLINSNINLPASLSINKDDRDIIIKPINTECKETRVKSRENSLIFLNGLAGGVILSPFSTTTDAYTGSMWVYDENVTLDCK